MSDIGFLLLIFIMLIALMNQRYEEKIQYSESTASGISLRRRETRPFEQTSTNVAARPMPSAFSRLVVTASVGQRPSTSLKIGLFLKI